MAASRDLRSHVTDIVTCPICLERFNFPKFLPCQHTFCLKCIEGHCRYNEPGDEIACPVCRQTFNIPESGVAGLDCNILIQSLVDAMKTAVAVKVPCEVCLLLDYVADSSVYCVDCSKKLCEPCSRSHRGWKGGPHRVIPMDSELETELIPVQCGKCDKHKDEYVKLFCFDDMTNICMMCFAEKHQNHTCKNVNAVAVGFIKQIDADLLHVLERVHEARKEIKLLDGKKHKFLYGVGDVRNKLRRTVEELKQLMDAQVNELMLEVQSHETETCNKIECLHDSLQMKLLAFETFCTDCSELKVKGKPSDITRDANDLHMRATELLQNDITLTNCRVPTISFVPVNIQELLGPGHNFLGTVTMNDTNILFLGEVGAGKSTCINALTQLLRCKQLECPVENCKLPISVRLTMVDPDTNDVTTIYTKTDDENENQTEDGESVTQHPTVYEIECGDRLISLIDTPGFGDTRNQTNECEHDRNNLEYIFDVLATFKHLNAIVILLKSSESRLTTGFKRCLQTIFTNLHENMCKNVVFCLTSSTKFEPGEILSVIRKFLQDAKLNLKTGPQQIYCVDNAAVKYIGKLQCSENVRLLKNERQKAVESWENSADAFNEMTQYIMKLEPCQVFSMLSLNDIRRKLPILSNVVIRVVRCIQDDIYELETKKTETNVRIKSIEQDKDSKMYSVDELLTTVLTKNCVEKLLYSETICTSSKCSTVNADGEVEYTQVCCDRCEWAARKRWCKKFGEDGKRATCGCDYAVHEWVTSLMKPQKRVIESSGKIFDKDAALRELGKQRDEITKRIHAQDLERQKLIEAMAKMSMFVEKSAAIKTDEYLNITAVIEREVERLAMKMETLLREKGDVDKNVEQMKKLRMISKEYHAEREENYGHSYSPEDIKLVIEELMNLPLRGAEIKEAVDAIEEARIKATQKSRRIRIPGHVVTCTE